MTWASAFSLCVEMTYICRASLPKPGLNNRFNFR